MEVLGVDNLGIFDRLGTISHKRSQSTWKREHKRSWGSAKSPILAILDACWLAQSISELDSYQQDINRINSKSETALGIMIDTDFWTAIRGFISEFGLFSWRVLSGQPTPYQASFLLVPFIVVRFVIICWEIQTILARVLVITAGQSMFAKKFFPSFFVIFSHDHFILTWQGSWW